MSILFFGLSAVAQLFNYDFKMLISFGICFKFLMSGLRAYSDSKYKHSIDNLLYCGGILTVVELVFLVVPFSLVET